MRLCLADYQLRSSSRKNENIEWTIFYVFNRNDHTSPRFLVIGDSICNGYHDDLRNKLADKASLTFWASSYCVTDPGYLPQLDLVLNDPKPDLVIFNNGLHSLSTDRAEWEEAYRLVIRFIQAKLPGVPLVLLNSTPLRERDERVDSLNRITSELAREQQLVMWDLFSLCDKFDPSCWRDKYHFTPEAIRKQADFLAEKILPLLPESTKNIRQASTDTGPDGALK